MIRSSEEVETKILFKQRDKTINSNGGPRFALQDIVNHVEDIIRCEYPKGGTRNGRSEVASDVLS